MSTHSPVVYNQLVIDYGLVIDVLRYCTRVTVCETATEQVYRWVDKDNGQEYAYGVFTKTDGLVEFHDTSYRKGAMFEGDRANELKKIGRYERPIEIIPLPADNKVTVLWNGGWDDYKIDPKRVRDMTAAELGKDTCFPTVGSGDWLKCSFVRQYGLGTDSQVVYITAHLGGGD